MSDRVGNQCRNKRCAAAREAREIECRELGALKRKVRLALTCFETEGTCPERMARVQRILVEALTDLDARIG